jgi:hypothetical protein
VEIITGTRIPVEKGVPGCLVEPVHEVVEFAGHARRGRDIQRLGQP